METIKASVFAEQHDCPYPKVLRAIYNKELNAIKEYWNGKAWRWLIVLDEKAKDWEPERPKRKKFIRVKKGDAWLYLNNVVGQECRYSLNTGE